MLFIISSSEETPEWRMGESYLQRKVFNRVRRLRSQGPSARATLVQTSSLDSVRLASGSLQQLASRLTRPMDADGGPEEDELGSDGDADDENNPPPAASNRTPQAVSARNGKQSQQQQQQKQGSERRKSPVSKLKAASRAILFFRRANSSTSTSCGPSKRRPGHLSSREASADHEQQPRGQASNNSGSCNQLPGSEVPQFIVPKMNALRLPLVCLIKSLDGELMREVFVHRYELGQYLIESLKVAVGINDCKYFGLKMAKSFEDQEDLRNTWLDLNESVCKQIKSKPQLIYQLSAGRSSSSNNSLSSPSQPPAAATAAATVSATPAPGVGATTNQRSVDFYLRIKFYPPNLARVQDPFLRNYLWLQLRRDLRLGKLTSSMNNLTLLMACVLQYELGDYRDELVERIPELSILPNQDLIEEQAVGVWSRRLVGHKRHQAQMQFLRAAVILETYGFDYYPVRDHQRQRAYLLGFNYAGIKTIRNGRIVHHFSWHSLSKISYERRMIIFHIYPTENSKRKQILGFKCLSNEDCQSLYMRLLEQKYFFTVDLAYFDKSIRRPSCLYGSPSQANSTEWSPMGGEDQMVYSPQSSASRFTSCGPSLDANTDQPQISNESGNSLEEAESQHSGSSVNCYTCDRRQQQEQVRPTQLNTTNSEPNFASSNLQDYPGPHVPGDHQAAEGTRHASTSPERSAAGEEARSTLLRRHQWHRHRPARQYFSEQDNDQPPVGDPRRLSCAAGLQSADGNRKSGQEEQGIWTKVMSSCLGSYQPSVAAAGNTVSLRLAEFVESMLAQPLGGLQCNETNAFSAPSPVGLHESSFVRLLMPALRFCLVIMVMNFVIRWTDSVSNSLIELLTISPAQSGTTMRDFRLQDNGP